MNKKRIVSGALGTVAAASALMMAAPVAASAQSANRHEHFNITSSDFNNNSAIRASGAFNATGYLVDLTPDSNTTELFEAVFPGGTFLIHVNLASSSDSLNQKTCVDRFRFTDTLTFSDGTGQFAGIGGTDTSTGRGTFTADRTPTGCDPNSGTGKVKIHARADLAFDATLGS